jgi:hypothetical protein
MVDLFFFYVMVHEIMARVICIALLTHGSSVAGLMHALYSTPGTLVFLHSAR